MADRALEAAAQALLAETRRENPDEAYDRLDDNFAFVVTCGECGCEYDNRDDGCPACGNSGSVSYSSADAGRWNEHARRMGY